MSRPSHTSRHRSQPSYHSCFLTLRVISTDAHPPRSRRAKEGDGRDNKGENCDAFVLTSSSFIPHRDGLILTDDRGFIPPHQHLKVDAPSLILLSPAFSSLLSTGTGSLLPPKCPLKTTESARDRGHSPSAKQSKPRRLMFHSAPKTPSACGFGLSTRLTPLILTRTSRSSRVRWGIRPN